MDIANSVAGGSQQKKPSTAPQAAATGSRAVDTSVLRMRIFNEELVSRCKAAVLAALGKFMLTSMRLPSVLELGADVLKKSDRPDRDSLRKALNTEDTLVSELGEALVPYYVTSSKQLDHCRMFL